MQTLETISASELQSILKSELIVDKVYIIPNLNKYIIRKVNNDLILSEIVDDKETPLKRILFKNGNL